MKLTIEKDIGGLTLELSPDSSKKPMVLRIDNSKADALLDLLKTARQASKFYFVLEL